MASFTVNTEHLQALLVVNHSGHKRSLGRWLSVDGELFWCAQMWDTHPVRLPGVAKFRTIDEWDCVHAEFGTAIRLAKKISESGAHQVAGYWRDDKLYRVVDQNEQLRFTTLNACERVVYQYCVNAIIWSFARGPAAAWALCETDDLIPNFRFDTDGDRPAAQIVQACLWGGHYPNTDKHSIELIRARGRWTSQICGHTFDIPLTALCGVSQNRDKVWLAVVDQTVIVTHDDSELEISPGLWLYKHTLTTNCQPKNFTDDTP